MILRAHCVTIATNNKNIVVESDLIYFHLTDYWRTTTDGGMKKLNRLKR